MKKILSMTVLCLFSMSAFAELYSVDISRIEKDLYKTRDGKLLIQTKYCYERPLYEKTILKYERYSYDNKLIFENNEVCEVVKVISM